MLCESGIEEVKKTYIYPYQALEYVYGLCNIMTLHLEYIEGSADTFLFCA